MMRRNGGVCEHKIYRIFKGPRYLEVPKNSGNSDEGDLGWFRRMSECSSILGLAPMELNNVH